jgi:enoyl-CoA hydratase
MAPEVVTRRRDGVAVVRLSAPQRRNALTREMARSLTRSIQDAAGEPEVGCIVVTGSGRSFCAGADRAILRSAADPGDREARAALGDIYECFIALGNAAVPTVAAVRGWAIGAGFNLALAADLRVVARDAQLLSGFARLGIHPGGGHLHLLERLVGRDAAAALAVFDQPVSGERAVALGLAFTAVPDEEVEHTALDLAATPGGSPALARLMAGTLRASPATAAWAEAVELERAAQLRSLAEGELTF